MDVLGENPVPSLSASRGCRMACGCCITPAMCFHSHFTLICLPPIRTLVMTSGAPDIQDNLTSRSSIYRIHKVLLPYKVTFTNFRDQEWISGEGSSFSACHSKRCKHTYNSGNRARKEHSTEPWKSTDYKPLILQCFLLSKTCPDSLQ